MTFRKPKTKPATSAELHREVERLVAEQAAAAASYTAAVEALAASPDDEALRRLGADAAMLRDSLVPRVHAAREAFYRLAAAEIVAEVVTTEAGIVEARRARQSAKAELLEGLCRLFPEKWARTIATEHKGQDFLTKESREKHDDLLNRRVALWNRHDRVKAEAWQNGVAI